MAGWNLKNGAITEYQVSEDRLWSLFNYVFSDASRKRNTYKFGLIKVLLDCAFDGRELEDGVYYSYQELFCRFAENYWNLVVKYDLRQMRPDGRSVYSKIESILKNAVIGNKLFGAISFDSIEESERESIVKQVEKQCKRFVVGALYEDFDGIIYSFDLKDEGLVLNYCVHEFMLKHKAELERLNYYAWAKFLEQVNGDDVLVRVIDKLELSTPRRNDLSVYRDILRKEFEESTCFYCGRKIRGVAHVDHFIPWSFVKDDKIWNFVLACPTCNEKKNNKIPSRDLLLRIENRNKTMKQYPDQIIRIEFENYSEGLLDRMWQYAKRSGLKEFVMPNGKQST